MRVLFHLSLRVFEFSLSSGCSAAANKNGKSIDLSSVKELNTISMIQQTANKRYSEHSPSK